MGMFSNIFYHNRERRFIYN